MCAENMFGAYWLVDILVLQSPLYIVCRESVYGWETIQPHCEKMELRESIFVRNVRKWGEGIDFGTDCQAFRVFFLLICAFVLFLPL